MLFHREFRNFVPVNKEWTMKTIFKANLKVTFRIVPLLLILTVLVSCNSEHRLRSPEEKGPLYDHIFERFLVIQNYYNTDQHDSLELVAPEVMELSKKHHYWRLYYMAWHLMGEDMAFLGEYERAMTLAQDMRQDAKKRNCDFGLSQSYAVMGLIFSLQHNYSESARWLKEAIRVFDTNIGGYFALNDLYFRYVETMRNGNMKDGSTDSILTVWKKNLDDHYRSIEYANAYAKYFDMLSTTLLDEERYDEALAANDSAEYYRSYDGQAISFMQIINDRVEILYAKGDYQQAMTCLDQEQHVIDSLEQAGIQVPLTSYTNVEELRHLIYAAQGRYQDAYHAKVKHDSLLHLIENQDTREQIQQLNRQYDVHEMQRQNQQLQQRSRFTTGGVAMVLGIIAMLVFLTTSNRWRHTLEVKNRQLERERNVVVAQNKQLAVERDRAEAASKAKTAFLQSMTHEIRTPLNAISGFTQVLTMPGMTLPESERHDFSERIQENTRMLTNILDDLILISNMEGSKELAPAEPTLPITIVATAADAIAHQLSKDVTIDVVCDLPDDETIMTHPTQISIILQKLLDNAAKFTQQGLITLSLKREGDQLHFAVSDTGPGIPEDKRDFIFERFTKLDAFTQGTGLGLWIARMLAEYLQGTLTLDTSYTGGSKFDLIIPISIQPQA